jgi:hypothetical protein
MSSEDSEHEALAKKRKLLRACDVCRKKKSQFAHVLLRHELKVLGF